MEDLLPWWYENIKKWAPEPDITICDFGMTKPAKALAKRYADTYLEYTIHERLAWFYKPRALLDTPYEYRCWVDIDCEVMAPIDDIFDYPTDDKIALTRDVGKGLETFWWATGVNVAQGKPKILRDWSYMSEHSDQRGDQEVLHEMIKQDSSYNQMIVQMPIEYQWLRLQIVMGQDSPNKKIVHWTGPAGKKHIREQLMT
jgi:hypothetical protein